MTASGKIQKFKIREMMIEELVAAKVASQEDTL